jgi:hypothetical protein
MCAAEAPVTDPITSCADYCNTDRQISAVGCLRNIAFVHHDVRLTGLNLMEKTAKRDTLFTTQ